MKIFNDDYYNKNIYKLSLHLVVERDKFIFGVFYDHKKIIKLKIPKLQKNQVKAKILRLIDCTTFRKVYFYHSGRDCDGVEYGRVMSFCNIFDAERYIEHSYKWADGPMSFVRISKKQADESENYQRDLFAEMSNY